MAALGHVCPTNTPRLTGLVGAVSLASFIPHKRTAAALKGNNLQWEPSFKSPDLKYLLGTSSLPVAEALSSNGTRSINTAIIVLLVLVLLSSLLSSGFTCTNTVSNPYQTFLGPIGVYTWNAISGVLTLLVMILFPVNVEGNGMSVELATKCISLSLTHSGSEHRYEYSYWILLLSIIFNIATIIIIYFYDHARYSKKKEQERPIENASKDDILF
uniref:CLRN3 protein n=1 Tax=Pavo cristatus TaxID=9049 RepID=A0A8C9EUE7_PAVCR